MRQINFIRIAAALLGCMYIFGCAYAELQSATPQPPGQPVPSPAPVQSQAPSPAQQFDEPVSPSSPVPITSCDAGGCWSTDAKRYNGGAGGVYLNKQGKPCQRQGPWMHCF